MAVSGRASKLGLEQGEGLAFFEGIDLQHEQAIPPRRSTFLDLRLISLLDERIARRGRRL